MWLFFIKKYNFLFFIILIYIKFPKILNTDNDFLNLRGYPTSLNLIKYLSVLFSLVNLH